MTTTKPDPLAQLQQRLDESRTAQAEARDTVTQLEHRLANLDGEQDAAAQAIDDANDALGDAVLGTDAAARDAAADQLAKRQQDQERLQAARGALKRNLVTARQKLDEAEHAVKWTEFEVALSARHVAFERAEKLAAPFFEAVNDAIATVKECWRLKPCEKVLTPEGWAFASDDFDSVANLADAELVSVRNALQDMTDKSRTKAALNLRLREYTKPVPGQTLVHSYDQRPRAPVIEPTPEL